MNCTLNFTGSVSELPMPKTQRAAMPKTQKVSEPKRQIVSELKTRIVNELKTAENAKLNQSLNQLFETHKDALAGFMRKRIGD